ncbi:NXPE family member 3-like isoform X1 [Anneissia japonica]|uniref:NXPE family member 3-like isoform X1 n=1 Tax=Anneissia japonica TaxID=1529436 RepID=UPI001425A3DC|nr:NXPE family member 3-like isoform X1 [Anneissia japonica]
MISIVFGAFVLTSCIRITFKTKNVMLTSQNHVWQTESDLKDRPMIDMFPNFLETEEKLRQDAVLPVFANTTDGVGSMGHTDPTMSKFFIKDGKPILFGEFFSVIVEAHDANGRHRVQGGDFWYPVVSNENRFATAGKVIDFKNGTYEIVFFAGWNGEMTVNIKLVHTSEAVRFILHEIWHKGGRTVWEGLFKVGKKVETSLCRLETSGIWRNQCEYPNPQALGGSLVLLCDRPSTLPCSAFYALHTSKGSTANATKIYSPLRETHDDFFTSKNNFARLTNGPIQLKSETNKSFDTIDSVIKSLKLQRCRPDVPEPLSDGFWENKIWHSFSCNTKQWTLDEIKVCVKGRKLLFIGDSTSRQWYHKLLAYLGFSLPKDMKQTAMNLQSDIVNVTFMFHSYIVSTRLELDNLANFEVDQLNSLPTDTCDYIITISPFAHYEHWTKEAYITRLENIRTGIIKFRKRCPAAIFAIKGSHARRIRAEKKKEINGYFTSDLLLYQFRRLLRETFSGMNVHFLDIWDMNLSYYTPNEMHMPFDVILQELFMYFSYVCLQ